MPVPQDFDWRAAVGGAWEQIGQLQFDFVRAAGLEPHHNLLDIGCGCLRGGVHFVRYLESGHYFGMDREQVLLDAAIEVELPKAGLDDKTIHLECRKDFDFSVFGAEFDFALAQSVFTHLPWNSIQRCLVNLAAVLKPGGQFFATFFEDPDGLHRARPLTHHPGEFTTLPDADPYHYDFEVFQNLATRADLDVRHIGEWSHPRGQRLMVFTPAAP